MVSRGKYMVNLALQRLRCEEHLSSDSESESLDESDTLDPSWCPKRKYSSSDTDKNNNIKQKKRRTTRKKKNRKSLHRGNSRNAVTAVNIQDASETIPPADASREDHSACDRFPESDIHPVENTCSSPDTDENNDIHQKKREKTRKKKSRKGLHKGNSTNAVTAVNIHDTSETIKPAAASKESTPTELVTEIGISNAIESEVPATIENDLVDHEEVITTGSCQLEHAEKRKRAKRGMSDPGKWQKNNNKHLRMQGKAYLGRGKVGNKSKFCKERPERSLGQTGCTRRCEKWGKSRKCSLVTEEARQKLFNAFWQDMTWDQKQVYVCSLVHKKETNTKTVDTETSRRRFTYIYHLRQGEEKIPVCKNMFLSTTGISEAMVYQWLDDTDHGIPRESFAEKKRRIPKEQNSRLENVRTFLEELPKLPSHYCRASSEKQYLEPIFNSLTDLHRVYREYCTQHDKESISKKAFLSIFNSMNLSLYRPKKDKCDVCCGFETNNIPEEEYNEHVRRKEEARNEISKDKEIALKSSDVKVLTMDLQTVMVCPKINASAVYYKTKLSCHNFTTFDLSSRNANCYFWHEGEGGLTANSFASCIADTVADLVATNAGLKEIILFSDGCGYQNRNVTLSNMLVNLSAKHNVTITQKIVEKGHTQMEADSVHSTIERILKNREIYSPHNYVNLIKKARITQPYNMKYISHDFFRDFTSLKYYDSIRPGNKAGDPTVTDIRALRYTPGGNIQFKLNFTDEFQELQKRRNCRSPKADDEVPGLYDGPLPIKKKKYEHLQQLKCVLPGDYHGFYDGLLHEN